MMMEDSKFLAGEFTHADMKKPRSTKDPVEVEAALAASRRERAERSRVVLDRGALTDSLSMPSLCLPLKTTKGTIEILPGILVSQHLIDDAVSATSAPGAEAAIERKSLAAERAHNEIREDIDASKRLVVEMMDRLKNPPDMKEKYVSYDSMPAPLQRVIKAYMEAAAADKELAEAIAAMGDLTAKAA